MAFSSRSRVHPIDTESFAMNPIETVAMSSASVGGHNSRSDQHNNVYSSPSRQQGMTLAQIRYKYMQSMLKSTDTSEERQQYMGEMIKFISEQNFEQKECSKFVPHPHQTVDRTDLKCSCGEIRAEHFFVRFPDTQQQDGNTEGILSICVEGPGPASNPLEVHQIVAEENRENEPPENTSSLDDEWTSQNIQKKPTNSFGNINFDNVDHIGRKKSAKYIRLSNEDSVEKTLELMDKHWKMMDPHPRLVISVVGGSEDFRLNGKMREKFNKGLIMAAKITDAWLITSGFNVDVMKYVGQAVQQGQSYLWKDGLAPRLQCIGIAPWGFVKDRHKLEGASKKERLTVDIESSNVIEQGKPLPLNPDHTHFIFVDDGYRNKNDGAAEFRTALEKKFAAPKTANGLEIPFVMVVVEGGPDAIIDAHKSLENGIPVVICAGTGRAADIIAYAYSGTKANDQGMEEELKNKISDAYKNSFKQEEANDKCREVLDNVKKCCAKRKLIKLFDMKKQVDLHQCILLALLKAHSCNDFMDESKRESLRLKQLRLTLAWNRIDLAQEQIFLENVQWSTGSLDTIMTEAIHDDNAEFARLLIQQGVIMDDYLTKTRLRELYKMRPKHLLMARMFFKLIGKDCMSIDDLPKLLNKLLDKYEWGLKDGTNHEHMDGDQMQVNEGHFIRPYKELFIWALLYGRHALAKLCWEMGEEPVTSAIAATMIYDSLSRACSRHELHLKQQFNEYKREFENLAIRVIDLCHSEDPDMAMTLVERKSPSWDSITCMEMAASANDQKFMSTAACQNSIGTQWRSGIQSHWLVVMLSAFIPIPLLAAAFLKIEGISNDIRIPSDHKNLEKLLLFLRSPIYKFWNSSFWYLVFTILFTYFILVDFKAYEIKEIELICLVTVCTYIVDELVYMMMLKKIREWYGILKILELLNFILVLVGFIFHKTAPDYLDAKAIYSVNCVIFYVRFTKMFIPNATLGPKLIMIKRMVEELLQFILVLLMFLLGYGVARHSLLYKHGKGDWETLKDVFYYPYWQLFEPKLDESTETDEICRNTAGDIRSCRTSHWLVFVLLACYLIVGQLLLINLLIAIFSNVFKTVEKNAQEIWKFQMYYVAMEYRNKTFFSPPFNIIIHIWFPLTWAIQRFTSKGTESLPSIDKVYDIMSYENYVPEEDIIAHEDLLQYQKLYEKEMMVNILNQNYVKMESMQSKVE